MILLQHSDKCPVRTITAFSCEPSNILSCDRSLTFDNTQCYELLRVHNCSGLNPLPTWYRRPNGR